MSQIKWRPRNRVTPVLSQDLCFPLTFSLGNKAHCWSKCVWLTSQSPLLMPCSPWSSLRTAQAGRLPPRSAVQLSNQSTSWYSCRQYRAHPFCFCGLLLCDCYSICFIKKEKEGRWEVLYMGTPRILRLKIFSSMLNAWGLWHFAGSM